MTKKVKNNKGYGSPSQKHPLRKPSAFTKRAKKEKLTQKIMYSFANLLNNRNVNCSMNLVWAIDITYLDVPLDGSEVSRHCLLAVIDHFSRKCILSKVFLLNKGKGTIKSAMVVKQLKSLIALRNPQDAVLLHSDNGPEFTSKEYFDFVDQHPKLVGSTSLPGNPQHNSIIENWFRKFKQENYAKVPTHDALRKNPNLLEFPKSVSSTQKLQTWVNNKVDFINKNVPSAFLDGYTSDKMESHFLASELEPPDILLAARNYYDEQSPELKNIEEHNRNIRNITKSTAWKSAEQDQREELMVQGIQYSVHQNDEILIQNAELKKELKIITKNLQELLPKQKKSHKKQVLRDPLTKDIYLEIMSDEKPPNVERISWSRFRITSTLLYFTGMRLGEAANITNEMLDKAIENKQMIIHQHKTDSERRLYLTEKAIEILQNLDEDRRNVYQSPNAKLYPFEGKDTKGYITLINKFLKPYREKYNLNLRSHSYRINFVTQTLRYSSVEVAQSLVGHKDIRSTLQYNRNKVSRTETLQILGQSL